MSTRTQIAFGSLKKPEALLYRHSDGYPSGVLHDIMPFLVEYDKKRGVDDYEYASARLMQYMTNEYDRMVGEGNSYGGILGYGVSKEYHGDIEFVYVVETKGVAVYEVVGSTEDIEKGTKRIGFVPYENYEDSTDYKRLTSTV